MRVSFACVYFALCKQRVPITHAISGKESYTRQSTQRTRLPREHPKVSKGRVVVLVYGKYVLN